MSEQRISRRKFTGQLAGTVAAASMGRTFADDRKDNFRLRYILASCMYGTAKLAEILPEVHKTGAEHIEIWARRHGDQREQIEAMGVDTCAELLKQHKVKLGSFTCFKFGIFGMQPEMKIVKRLGGDLVICNSGGPRGLKGDTEKSAVHKFAEKLKPHVAAAEESGVTIGLENHSGSLINSPDTQHRLLDLIDSKHFGIALAPYHLPQEESLIATLIHRLGERLLHFQAWQFGMGCHKKLPKEQELLQLPGRGQLDFVPLLAALKKIDYQGRTEIFMHPTPRGIPILESTDKVTAEINRARTYLTNCLAKT